MLSAAIISTHSHNKRFLTLSQNYLLNEASAELSPPGPLQPTGTVADPFLNSK